MTHNHGASRRRFPASAGALTTGAAASAQQARGTAQSPPPAGRLPFLIRHSTDTLTPLGKVPRMGICGDGRADVDPPCLHDRKPETMGEDFNWARPRDEDLFA
jgi:hypothetical protein